MTFFWPAGDALPGGAILFIVFNKSKILPPISDVAPACVKACVNNSPTLATICIAAASPPRLGVGVVAPVDPIGAPPAPGGEGVGRPAAGGASCGGINVNVG